MKSILYNITQESKKGQAERASLSLYAIFVYIPATTTPTPPILLRIEPLPVSRIPMAVQFLTSALCCTLGDRHDSNALQRFIVKMSTYYTLLTVVQNPVPTDFFSCSLSHTYSPPATRLNRKSFHAASAFCFHDMNRAPLTSCFFCC